MPFQRYMNGITPEGVFLTGTGNPDGLQVLEAGGSPCRSPNPGPSILAIAATMFFLDGQVGQDDDVGLGFAPSGSRWSMASMEIDWSARMRVMSASTPGLSSHAQAQVVAGFHLVDGQHRQAVI